MHTSEKLTSPREAFANYPGRGVRVGIIDSGVNPAHPHVGGVAGGTRITSGDADGSTDYLDYIGHGTAVAGAIREKAPDAQLYAVKVFDRALTTNIDAIIKAIDWCVENEMNVINLSLGTVNIEHRKVIEQAVGRAAEKRSVLVAAREMSGKPSLPGCLPSVIGVVVDWQCARDRYGVNRSDDGPVFIASAYPREIPGVPRERNMNGISFAVANMTGFVARTREFAPDASVDQLKRLLVEESTNQ
ncbi:MAG TPA: S8 family serine peptidase [Blastocatellia bacterium]|nr:S8 family serine peptidase [Blastocatellia bacterium]